jgi:hypothetical protein
LLVCDHVSSNIPALRESPATDLAHEGLLSCMPPLM